jgi:hypothetical protein
MRGLAKRVIPAKNRKIAGTSDCCSFGMVGK